MPKRHIRITSIFLCLGLLTFLQTAELAETKKDVSPPGTISFIGKNAFARIHGTFKQWSVVKADFGLDDLDNANIEIIVDVASVHTKRPHIDNRLRSEKFFDAQKYPKAKIRIYEIIQIKNTRLCTAKLDFTLRGIKKTYTLLDVTMLQKNPVKVDGKFTFNRLDFNIGKPKTINPFSIKENIPITFTVTLP